jgi:hypothetical protein
LLERDADGESALDTAYKVVHERGRQNLGKGLRLDVSWDGVIRIETLNDLFSAELTERPAKLGLQFVPEFLPVSPSCAKTRSAETSRDLQMRACIA